MKRNVVRLHCMLFSLPPPMDCDLVNKRLDLIHVLEGAGATVHFTWISSNVGIPLNKKTDRLAQCALQDVTVDPGGTEYILGLGYV
ncbi:hypothetical protein E2C01_043988 [Portunus trituberculatus]|uniref:RNase H type-1 domain-containing protein n=1 Tax=Portunus trituberculatus TaxID=210409 RepID=A0A5B7FXV5_PORTR|nr:hypothetical protein [Portunus trituberculatus]